MRCLLLVFLMFSSGTIWSQSQTLFPVSFLQPSSNYSFDNPASSSYHHPKELKILNSFYTGLRKNVGVYYLDASLSPGDSLQRRHTYGVIVHSEYETELLKRSRLYFRYAWQTFLTPKVRFSAGISLGFLNYYVKGTNSSAGSSVFVPDGMTGLWLHGKYFNLGISANQFVGAGVKPVNRTFIAKRYAIVIADYRFRISDVVKLLCSVRAYGSAKNYQGFGIAANFILSESFTAGAIYHHNSGTGLNVGINNFRLISIYGDLSFTYFQPNAKLNVLQSNRMEIMIKTFFRAKK